MKQVVSFIVLVSLMFSQGTLALYATINISIINKANSHTNAINSASGIPIININKANSSGVSSNSYDQLDIGKEGVIFNNADDLTNTQLAGWIVANNNFAKGDAAKLILNTVKSKKSEILGYMEVAGKKSDLIILNTNGIVADGAGFINVKKGEVEIGRG